jgi:hypothetical protein
MHRPTKLAQPLRSRFKFKIGQARVIVIVLVCRKLAPRPRIVPQVGLFSKKNGGQNQERIWERN